MKPKQYSKLKSSDYNIYKIKYYGDNGRTDKQHHERAIAYIGFFWKMVERVTGHSFSYWNDKYFLHATECAIEELHEQYKIIIPESEEYYHWYIPKSMSRVSSWVEQNCKLPFKKLLRAHFSATNLNREATTWKRESASARTKTNLNSLK